MTMEPSEDRLVTLIQAETEFQANMTVAILADAGIEAIAFGAAHGALPLSARFLRVPVQVRASQLEQAKAVLASNPSDTGALNWDDVDLGEREDALPLKTSRGMPLVARIAFVVAALLLLAGIAAFVVSAFTP